MGLTLFERTSICKLLADWFADVIKFTTPLHFALAGLAMRDFAYQEVGDLEDIQGKRKVPNLGSAAPYSQSKTTRENTIQATSPARLQFQTMFMCAVNGSGYGNFYEIVWVVA